MENEQNNQQINWQDIELSELGQNTGKTFDKLPAMKFEENKPTTIGIDFKTKFETYTQQNDKGVTVTKAIIPVVHENTKKTFWLNKKNPIYRQLLELGKNSDFITVNIMQTGKGAETKYLLLK